MTTLNDSLFRLRTFTVQFRSRISGELSDALNEVVWIVMVLREGIYTHRVQRRQRSHNQTWTKQDKILKVKA